MLVFLKSSGVISHPRIKAYKTDSKSKMYSRDHKEDTKPLKIS